MGPSYGTIVYGHGYDKVPEWNEISFYAGREEESSLRDAGSSIRSVDESWPWEAILLIEGPGDMSPIGHFGSQERQTCVAAAARGFPTGIKWEMMRKEKSEKSTSFCKRDEGDRALYEPERDRERPPYAHRGE
jgi:hypothetical protein